VLAAHFIQRTKPLALPTEAPAQAGKPPRWPFNALHHSQSGAGSLCCAHSVGFMPGFWSVESDPVAVIGQDLVLMRKPGSFVIQLNCSASVGFSVRHG
jgi:hypothetical protein